MPHMCFAQKVNDVNFPQDVCQRKLFLEDGLLLDNRLEDGKGVNVFVATSCTLFL